PAADVTATASSLQLKGLAPGTHIFQMRLTHTTGTVLSEPLTIALPLVENPTQLKISSGDNQVSPPGSLLPSLLSVLVLGASGKPVAGVPVGFPLASGNAKLSATTAVTGLDGTAKTSLTLGPSPGAVVVVAAVSGIPSVSFHLAANPVPSFTA